MMQRIEHTGAYWHRRPKTMTVGERARWVTQMLSRRHTDIFTRPVHLWLRGVRVGP